jgi:uncharacterized membrane protein YdjX (TVP38/TMEM64 family)
MVTLLLRITPGPPFFAQSYLLALGRVPFGSYMLVSVLVAWTLSAPVIILGDSLVSGSAGKFVFGLLVIVAAVIVFRLVRKRVARRHPEAVAEAAGEDAEAAAPATRESTPP